MSIKLVARVWELDLEHAEQKVLMALADHAQDDGSRVYPSLGYVAWKTGYDRRYVRRVMARLKERGAAMVVQRGGQDLAAGSQATEYRLDLSVLPIKPPYRADASEDAVDLELAGTETHGGAIDPPVGSGEPRGEGLEAPGGRVPRPPQPSVKPSSKPETRAREQRQETKTRPHPLPKGFALSSTTIEWARDRLSMPAAAVRYWFEEFVDAARAGKFKPMIDWEAALRNSLRRQVGKPVPATARAGAQENGDRPARRHQPAGGGKFFRAGDIATPEDRLSTDGMKATGQLFKDLLDEVAGKKAPA
jgi:hypothetical protein